MRSDSPPLAVVLATGELERLYSGLSLLVSTAAEGNLCRGLAVFRSLALLLDDGLLHQGLDPANTPLLAWAGRETFARSLVELRDTALEQEGLELFACSASVETMGLATEDIEARLDGVRSTPRFLREAATARLVYV